MSRVTVRRWTKIDIKRRTRVLLRLELNVPIKNGRLVASQEAAYRLEQALPELRALRAQGASVVIVAHLGDPGGRKVRGLSLAPVVKWLATELKQDIRLLSAPTDPQTIKAVMAMGPGEIVALENIRFLAGEESNDSSLAKALADLGQVFVNNAFGVMHRDHASVTGVAKFIPAFAGELVAREVSALAGPWPRPAIAIQGGAKLELKLPLLKALLNDVQDIYAGGALAVPLAVVAGHTLPRKIVESIDKNDLEAAKRLWKIGQKQLRIPVDFVLNKAMTQVLDIGPRSVEELVFGVGQAKSVFWNGPLGRIEELQGQMATIEVARAIERSKLKVAIAGGGETVDFLRSQNLDRGFSHLSTGGGAALAFVAHQELPGLVTLC